MIARFFALSLGMAIGSASMALAEQQQLGASRTALATVADVRGRTIVDIDLDDFVVRESGQLRDVLSVRVADYPIVLVIDNGSGAGQDFATIREAVARFIGRIGRRPLAIVLADPPRPLAGFDDDRSVVVQRLEAAVSTTSGEGLFEAVLAGARAIADSGSPFSAIVVISARPLASVPDELLTPILESGAAVHAIVNGGGSEAAGRPSETLRALSEQTHGQFVTIFSAASYRAALERLADRLAPELLVEYVVPVGSSSGNNVRLGVKIPGARVVGLGVK